MTMHVRDDVQPALEPIAIVGMACRLPGGIDCPKSMWDLLKANGTARTTKVPANRFNIDAYLHENPDRPGSFNVPGGYFLDGNLEDFDPKFFNMSPIEAMWLDPQQRKMLEVTYECFESGGIDIASLAGSNTGVFVGSFTADYQQMSFKEADFRHSYAATGVDPGIISTRLGNVFDLRGPNSTINTACSSSIYAIHQACNALRAGDCDSAVAGGVNLILTVDQHMNTAKLGVLSPTSTCHTFDALADGYGRGEGVGALYLQRLSDAIRDGNPVRAVIRASAVNSNGKVAGYGITYPSIRGQEAVVRAAYAKSGLDPLQTAYVECHGTGTPVGDPVETQAIAFAMNGTRPKARPLIVGAVKPSIGHSEAASGIFAVIKAALMTESGVIPGTYGLKTINPSILEADWNIFVSRETALWPDDDGRIRRAGVSSFGYGGTNGHVIVEGPRGAHHPLNVGRRRREAEYVFSGNVVNRPYLLGFSAHDRRTLERNIEAHAHIVEEFYLPDLAHTLMTRRSRFSVRGFTVARQDTVEAAMDKSALNIGTAPATAPELCFIFTGQGAQWPALGAAAMDAFPSFLATIRALDAVLQSLDTLQPSWSLEDALRRPADENNRINEADVSQPVCTAVQIAIVDLFQEWNITPRVVVGHSSGEIAGAYAAGFISGPEAIIAAYVRGYAVSKHAPAGAMLAVGLGWKEAEDWLPQDDSIAIACQNSPSSTTLSGSQSDISKLADELREKRIFARELPTGRAYHSKQMIPVGQIYDDLLVLAMAGLGRGAKKSWRRPRATWISSVTGAEYTSAILEPTYWSRNLISRVRFDDAIVALGTNAPLAKVKVVVEIGPHSALSGPFRQICRAHDLQGFTYVPSLVRGKDSAEKLLRTAGSLWTQNYNVNVAAVNSTGEDEQPPKLLVDLPPYQWNYEKVYWAEPRLSQEQRNPTHGRHDLLGSKMFGLSSNAMAWKNYLRHRDIPWLKDHQLGKEAIFPAAAHLSMAAEAMWQVLDVRGVEIESVTFRDVILSNALAIPDGEDGIETQLHLDVVDGKWFKFSVQSWAAGQWTVHCEGQIAANHHLSQTAGSGHRDHPVDLADLKQRIASKHWYESFKRVGFEYGPSFQTLSNIRTNDKTQHAAGDVIVTTTSMAVMTGESRYLLHPSTIDGCLHLVIVSINSGRYADMRHGVVPIRFEEITIWRQTRDEQRLVGQAVGWCERQDGRYFDCGAKLLGPDGRTIFDGRRLCCVSYEAAVPQENEAKLHREPYAETVWRPDVTTLTTEKAANVLRVAGNTIDDVTTTWIDLAAYKKHPSAILILLGDRDALVHTVMANASPNTAITVIISAESKANLETQSLPSNVKVLTVKSYQEPGWHVAVDGRFDMLLVGQQQNLVLPSTLTGLTSYLDKDARAVFQLDSPSTEPLKTLLHATGFSGIDLLIPCPGVSMAVSTFLGESRDNNAAHASRVIILRSLEEPWTWNPLKLGPKNKIETHDLSDIQELNLIKSGTIIVDDAAGTLWTNLEDNSFELLRAVLTCKWPIVWLTAGVNEGASLDAAMCAGFLRVLRSEFASARVLWLDADRDHDLNTMTESIRIKMGHVTTKTSGCDTEFWLRDGIFHVPRILPHARLNQQFSARSGLPQDIILSEHVTYHGEVSDGQLVFHRHNDAVLDEGQLRLRVEYASSTNPTVVSGTITNVHHDLDQSAVGFKAVLIAPSSFKTAITADIDDCVMLRDDQTQAALVAALPSFVSGINAIKKLANAQTGEHIIALSSKCPLFLAAISSLAAAFNLRFTSVTATAAEKEVLVQLHNVDPDKIIIADDADSVHDLLKNRLQSANVVISREFSPLAQEVWRYTPNGARFVLDDGKLDKVPDLVPFTRGASFLSTGLARLQRLDPKRVARLLKEAMAFLDKNTGSFGSEQASIDVSDAAHMYSSGFAAPVVRYNYGFSVVKDQPIERPIEFSPAAAYLLVGCLGGLGRSLTTFMMERGARKFVFLSRTGANKPDAAQLVESIRKAGATALVYRGDASSQTDVDKIVSEITATHPIRGVVHAAMVLHDVMFESMSLSQFQAVVAPKAKGAQVLHRAFQNHDLDFFVMTSSISATMGNPGQANYCAANSYLDAIAWHRNLHGLPGVSLILPMVLGVGVVAENNNIESSLSKKAMYGINEREMLQGFQTAMMQPTQKPGQPSSLGDSQIILGLETTFLAAAIQDSVSMDAAYWYRDARFDHFRAGVDAMGKRSGDSDVDMAAAMLSTDGNAGCLLGCDFIIKKLSSMLSISSEEFQVDGRSVGSYGLDSMVGAEFRNWLFNHFGLQITFQALLGSKMSVTALASLILSHLGA